MRNPLTRHGRTLVAVLVVKETSGGVGTAELGVSVGDASVATITDVTALGEGASNGESTHPPI